MSGQSVRLVNNGIRPPGGKHAFTLVEVVIAMAIMAFAVIGMLGLMTVVMQSARNADTQAASAAIVTTVFSKLSSNTFTNAAASLPLTNYFTHEGAETNAAAGIYLCTMTDVSPSDATTNFIRQVRVQICWPIPACTQTNIVVGSFVKYD